MPELDQLEIQYMEVGCKDCKWLVLRLWLCWLKIHLIRDFDVWKRCVICGKDLEDKTHA